MVGTLRNAIGRLFDDTQKIALWVDSNSPSRSPEICFWKEEARFLPEKFMNAKIVKITAGHSSSSVLDILVRNRSRGFEYDPRYSMEFAAGKQEVKYRATERTPDDYRVPAPREYIRPSQLGQVG